MSKQATYQALCNATFAAQNELRLRGAAPYVGPKANTIFRKNVMATLMEATGCSLASAATHYNNTLQDMRKNNPAAVEGVGRTVKQEAAPAAVEAAPVQQVVAQKQRIAYVPTKLQKLHAVRAFHAKQRTMKHKMMRIA